MSVRKRIGKKRNEIMVKTGRFYEDRQGSIKFRGCQGCAWCKRPYRRPSPGTMWTDAS